MSNINKNLNGKQELERNIEFVSQSLLTVYSDFIFQLKQNLTGEKKLTKEINARHLLERKNFETQVRREYKQTKERWKQELSCDESTTKRQRDASLQYDDFKQKQNQIFSC